MLDSLKAAVLFPLLVAAAGSSVAAAPIILDTFTANDGTSIAAHVPDVDGTNGRYLQTGQSNTFPGAIQNNAFATSANDGAGISISSTGGYVKPTTLTVSATLEVNSISGVAGATTGDGTNGRGLGLGFERTLNSAGNTEVISASTFNGLILAPDGTLSLFTSNETGNSTFSGSSVAFGGAFSKTTPYTLSYTVDTTTGAISDISLSGSTADYSGLTASTFTNVNTAFAAITSSSSSAGTGGIVDNFSVVPEPASLGLLSLGALGLLARRRRA